MKKASEAARALRKSASPEDSVPGQTELQKQDPFLEGGY